MVANRQAEAQDAKISFKSHMSGHKSKFPKNMKTDMLDCLNLINRELTTLNLQQYLYEGCNLYVEADESTLAAQAVADEAIKALKKKVLEDKKISLLQKKEEQVSRTYNREREESKSESSSSSSPSSPSSSSSSSSLSSPSSPSSSSFSR